MAQRVSGASVASGGEELGSIGLGLVLLLGVEEGDAEPDLEYVLEKTLNMRIFPDEAGRMNLSLLDVGGGLLVVSQFTLLGDVGKGRRPSFAAAAGPAVAEGLYDAFIVRARARGARVSSGRFGAMMELSLTNDGPVTILMDSRRRR